jgi:hypothetical protein
MREARLTIYASKRAAHFALQGERAAVLHSVKASIFQNPGYRTLAAQRGGGDKM